MRAVAIFVGAAALVVFNGYCSSTRPLWFDEGCSWRLAAFDFPDLTARAQRDCHPPLYYLVLKTWIAGVGDSAVAMRTLSALQFLVAAVGTYVLGAHLGRAAGRPTFVGSLAVALLCLCPYAVRTCQEVRMYNQGLALAVWLGVCMLRVVEGGRSRRGWEVGVVACSTALAYTHHFGLFTVAAAHGWALLNVERRDLGRRLASVLVIAVLYLPYVPVVLQQAGRVDKNFWIGRFSVDGLISAVDELTFYPEGGDTPAERPIALIAVYAVSLLMNIAVKPRYGAFLALMALGPFAAAAAVSLHSRQSIVLFRYFYFALPYFVLSMAFSAGSLRGVGRAAAAYCLVFIFAAAAWSEIAGLASPRGRGVMEAAATLRARAAADDRILAGHVWTFFPTDHQFHGKRAIRQFDDPSHAIDYIFKFAMREGDLVSRAEAETWRGRIWLIEMTGFGGRLFDPPSNWKILERYRFFDAFTWQGCVVLECYSAEEPADRRPGGSAAPRSISR